MISLLIFYWSVLPWCAAFLDFFGQISPDKWFSKEDLHLMYWRESTRNTSENSKMTFLLIPFSYTVMNNSVLIKYWVCSFTPQINRNWKQCGFYFSPKWPGPSMCVYITQVRWEQQWLNTAVAEHCKLNWQVCWHNK